MTFPKRIYINAVLALLFVTAVNAQRTCRIATLRVTGKNSLFALACRCGDGREALGRSVRFLDPKTPDTISQEELTVNCIEHRKPEMAHACQRSSRDFEHLAAHVLRECMDKRPVNPSPEGLQPFTFNRDQCETEFRELDVDRVEALLVCACTQRPGYLVHPGVIQFITSGSPIGAGEEQKALEKCTKDMLPSLDKACRDIPERFDLRSARMFNVCCKRIRVQFALDKLKCQATVPDDVSSLDLTYVNPQ